MMKTITDYRPMIFSEMAANAEKRTLQRRHLVINGALVVGYCIVGFLMIWNTGFAPWHWQFWVMFGPLVVAGELTIHALRSR
jgi:MFS family permease